jgi:hypothetical protein
MGDDEYGEEEEGGYTRAQEEEYDFMWDFHCQILPYIYLAYRLTNNYLALIIIYTLINILQIIMESAPAQI